MPTDRQQRQIDRLLDSAEEAAARDDWTTLLERAEMVLAIETANVDALSFVAVARRGLGHATGAPTPGLDPPDPEAVREATPTSFAGGRYKVQRFLGEGTRSASTSRTTSCSTATWRSR